VKCSPLDEQRWVVNHAAYAPRRRETWRLPAEARLAAEDERDVGPALSNPPNVLAFSGMIPGVSEGHVRRNAGLIPPEAFDRSPPLLRMGRCHRRRWGDVIVAQHPAV